MHGDAVVGTHFFGAARLPGIYHTKLHEEVLLFIKLTLLILSKEIGLLTSSFTNRAIQC
jgi:hypothetical protein